MDKTEAQILQTEKNHVLYDKALLLCKISRTDRRLFLFLCCFAYKYSTMISSMSDSTCAMIPNDQILSLTAKKRQPPRKLSTVFRVWVHALFEWQNCPKVAFVLVLDAFALCINGPLKIYFVLPWKTFREKAIFHIPQCFAKFFCRDCQT